MLRNILYTRHVVTYSAWEDYWLQGIGLLTSHPASGSRELSSPQWGKAFFVSDSLVATREVSSSQGQGSRPKGKTADYPRELPRVEGTRR
jgi:hypothetical protein